MRNCFISCSFLSKEEKQEIKDKVRLMGGYYSDSLAEGNTHLISGSVKSEKYIVSSYKN